MIKRRSFTHIRFIWNFQVYSLAISKKHGGLNRKNKIKMYKIYLDKSINFKIEFEILNDIVYETC